MAQITPLRAIVALLTLFGLGFAAHAAGASVGAVILAGIGGILAMMILLRQDTEPTAKSTAKAEPDSGDAPPQEQYSANALEGPSLDELMTAIDDPCLLVVGRRVEKANPAALALLGDHIIDEDIRLAIRHPGAAERLVGEHAGEDSRTAIELVGIGDRERPWELIVHDLSGGSRFVRLADRSSARSAEKMRVDFVANASHELRTPLASLLGYIETLQDEAGGDAKTRKRFLSIMEGEASRMQGLIGDLMSLSRIEAEKFRAPDQEFALAPVIAEACETACAVLGKDASRITIQGSAEVDSILGDPAQIGQLVSNLAGNALKYGREDSAVMVRYAPLSDRLVRITVEDQGDGISADHLPRLTERFYRVDAGRSRSMGGTGLGLAIVKHIVERHRGQMRIGSIEGKGTTVTVDLPKNPPSVSSPRNENVTRDNA